MNPAAPQPLAQQNRVTSLLVGTSPPIVQMRNKEGRDLLQVIRLVYNRETAPKPRSFEQVFLQLTESFITTQLMSIV